MLRPARPTNSHAPAQAESVATVPSPDVAAAKGCAPFLRWAGGKARLLPRLTPHLPTKFKSYVEPFLGGGAIFFHLAPDAAVLGDANLALITTFRAVRDDVEGVIRNLRKWRFSESEYYRVRDKYSPRTDASRAARFIYLNKNCWNGLYRVNTAGEFNVPFGRNKTGTFLYPGQLRVCSAALRTAEIECSDFESVLDKAEPGDFVYVDPPYVTSHNDNGFIEYNAPLFTLKDQKRLADAVRRRAADGVQLAVSNAAHAVVRDLYAGFEIVEISRASSVASATWARRQTTEFLIKAGY